MICLRFQIGESSADTSDLRGNLLENIELLILLGNLLTDILYAVVDPTIKLQ